jgi:hypothetical protein
MIDSSSARLARPRIRLVSVKGNYFNFMPVGSSRSPRRAPNPALFLAVALSSFAAYYALVHHRAATAPASSRPRLNDHPLVWPVHSPDQDRDGSQPLREDR